MDNAAVIKEYYEILARKDIESLGKYLHEDVEFRAPLAKHKGKADVLEATKGFAGFFKELNIRTSFGSGDQAVLLYDLVFPEPVGNIPTASVMIFRDGLVSHIELFYDARPFEKVNS
ncbi:MAG: hypothetical protein S4CHLAM37_04810 [Chlamydiia bacterium]|nr:hypothetical protein [Chlamydiia bacterium]